MDSQQIEIVPSIYPVLADHQRGEDWPAHDTIVQLQVWAERFNVEFKLDIPEVSLCIERLDIRRCGHFRYGHNGFGLKGEIAINVKYLSGQRAGWETLGTLLHELIHAWQQAHGKHGKGNYHNTQFRAKAAEFGLIVDKRGVTQYAQDSPFQTLLRFHGVDIPDFEQPMVIRRKVGQSKLIKWSCECTNVRVAIPDFRAKCLKCGALFCPA